MRATVGVFLILTTPVAWLFVQSFASSGDEIAVFFENLGFFGPIVLFGLYLAAGGWSLSRKAHLIYLLFIVLCNAASVAADQADGPPFFRSIEIYLFVAMVTLCPILLGLTQPRNHD